MQLPLLRVSVVVRGEAARSADTLKTCVDRPVFLRHECADLIFPVHDEPRRNGLHTARRQPLAHLFPQQRTELIADYPVEHTPRLLRVHEVLIDGARLRDGAAHHVLCDLVEGHAHRLIVRNVQQILEVPRDRLSLAVRVSCEIDVLTFFCAVAQLLDDGLLACQRAVFRLEIMLDVHAQRALRQIAQMAHAGLDLVVRAKIFPDGLCLRRRLDNDQICFFLRHFCLHAYFSAREKRLAGSLLI